MPEAPRASRAYPDRPIVGVGGVILHEGRVGLIRRRSHPRPRPGGTGGAGETLEEAVAREMLEETGLVVSVGPVVEVFDRILRDDEHRVQYHYVLVDYVCRVVAGELRSSSDAEAAAWAHPDEFAAYGLTAKARAVVERAFELAGRVRAGW